MISINIPQELEKCKSYNDISKLIMRIEEATYVTDYTSNIERLAKYYKPQFILNFGNGYSGIVK